MVEQTAHPAPGTRAKPHAFCLSCGYALVGLASRQCPECGRAFDPRNPHSYAPFPLNGRPRRIARRIAQAAIGGVVFAGLGLGWMWWGWEAEQATVKQLEELGAHFDFKLIGPNWSGAALGQRFAYIRERVERVDLVDRSSAEIQAIAFGRLKYFKTLTLLGCELHDGLFARLADASNIQRLILRPRLSDTPSLAFLIWIPQLTALSLSGTEIKDAALAYVATLRRLEVLDLGSTGVTDDGLQYLQGLAGLKELYLTHTSITDAGLAQLRCLRSLRVLGLRYAQVSRAGIAMIEDALPALSVRGYDPKFHS